MAITAAGVDKALEMGIPKSDQRRLKAGTHTEDNPEPDF
jgi:hypothetical protein